MLIYGDKRAEPSGYCSCCGAANINGKQDHDPECLWYAPTSAAVAAGKALAERARKFNEDTLAAYRKITDRKIKAMFERDAPWLKGKHPSDENADRLASGETRSGSVAQLGRWARLLAAFGWKTGER